MAQPMGPQTRDEYIKSMGQQSRQMHDQMAQKNQGTIDDDINALNDQLRARQNRLNKMYNR